MSIAFDERRVDEGAEAIFSDCAAVPLVSEKRCKNGFSKEVIDTLLKMLATDDAFRSFFVADPRGALASIGHVTEERIRGIAGEDPAMCCQVDQLASKETIAATAAHLRSQMLIFNPFMCPGLVQS